MACEVATNLHINIITRENKHCQDFGRCDLSQAGGVDQLLHCTFNIVIIHVALQ